VVRLKSDERDQLDGLIRGGREAACRRRHAEVLLLVDKDEHGSELTDTEAAERTGFSRRTVEQIRERCVTEGLTMALERKRRSRERSRRLDGEGEGEAKLVSLACSDSPEGRSRWTLQLLADKLVELDVVESISQECVRQVLKKHHQTLAKTDVVHTDTGQRPFRVSNGVRTGGL
jgi:transposase